MNLEEDDTGQIQGLGALGKAPAVEPVVPFNPFKNDTAEWGVLELLKTVLLTPLCVVRALLWITSMLLGFLCTKVALIGAKDVLKKPFPAWRRPLLFPVRFFARVLLFACGFQWIHIKGKPAPRDQAPIIVSNHVTFVDPVFIFFRHLPVIVTAQENLSLPIAGAIMKAMQVISVNRVSQDSRRHASGEIKRRAMCNDWSHVMLFPEATTTNGKALVTFKAGAFTPGYAVQPMVIRYPHVKVDPSWVGEGPPVHKLLFRLMTQFHNYMEVEYLPIIKPTFTEQKNPRLFAERVRVTMAKALNVMVTDHSYEDAALATEATKQGVDSGAILLEFTKIERLFHLSSKDAKHLFSKFRALGCGKRGVVAYEDFAQALELPNSPLARQLFQFFDRESSGYITFHQYAFGLAFILKHKYFTEASEATLKYCAGDESDHLRRDDLGVKLKDVIPSLSDEQVSKIFDRLDTKKTGEVSRADFLSFLEANPEYVALFLISRPDLISKHKKDDRMYMGLNGMRKSNSGRY
ncbi:hypothetical protein MPTK1_7g07720 [Marchantia polymorpha subsp. ruderalis]|nr:hypothetical protein MARPO_0076s0022 [Marchantia polymorpha]BBN16600.1 hypothetical protein Mp_7g07720 [Marchantia polymorpha subsp. ruderalis]|eukprot:PTQ34777.1 hypothetical protein MARPO_0076s0022 [Marchantia polymorpha]